MIDVMLARVMLLMLAAPLALQKPSLPLAGGERPVQTKTRVLSGKSTDELHLDGAAIKSAQLTLALASSANAANAALLEAHPRATARYGDVATVLTLAHNNVIDAIRVEEGVRTK